VKNSVFDYLILFLNGVFIFAALGCFGCVSTPQDRKPVALTNVTEDKDIQILQDGMEAFAQEDYNEASAKFEALIEQTNNDVIMRRALYALACTKFAQAENNKDLNQALDIWNRWEKLRYKEYTAEDPLMLSPYFNQMSSSSVSPTSAFFNYGAKINKGESSKTMLEKKQKEIQYLKSKLESKERETESLQIRIKKLKEQINSLEAIHREIQEKKKEVSSQ